MIVRNRDSDTHEGERRKNAAHLLLEANRERYLRDARRAMLDALLVKGTATADDVRAAIDVPTGMNPVVAGVVPGALARAGIIRQGGFVKSSRPEAHARPVAVWRLADPRKAELWLAAHPPLSEMTTADAMKSAQSETPAAGTDGASVQKSFPGFEKGGWNHG